MPPVGFAVDQGKATGSWPKGLGVKWRRALTGTANPTVDVLEVPVESVRKLMQEKSETSDVKKG